MFDLETAITDWKQSLAARESLSADNIAELETHLRDAVSSLASGSLNEEEAFLIARRRVGSTDVLGQEYAKENPTGVWVRRLKWMCLGYLVFGCYLRTSVNAISFVVQRFGPLYDTRLNPTLYHQLLLIIHALSFAFVLGSATILVMQRPLWLGRALTRFRELPDWAAGVLIVAMVVLPDIFFLSWVVALGSDPISLLIQYFNNVSLAIVLPAISGAVVFLLHRRERVLELA